MGDVPIRPVPEPEPTRAERVNAAVQPAVRYAITGSDLGSLRRPILFVVAGIALVVNAPIVGIVALMILALTDQVVPL